MALSLKLEELPPELFPAIVSHLPLYATPTTVLSFALANRRISETVLPLINTCIILRREKDGLKMIQRLLANPNTGLAVRELYIMSELSREARNGDYFPFNVVSGLQDVIEAGLLPYIHTLGLTLLDGRHLDEDEQSTVHCSKLRSGFFDNLHNKCPRLQALILRDIGDEEGDSWLDDSGLFELNLNLSTLSLHLPYYSGPGALNKLFNNLPSLSSSLHTLRLSKEADLPQTPLVFPFSFPVLRSLTLEYYLVEDTAEAMKFWKRHPSLEFLECTISYNCPQYFFNNEFPLDFLPNIRHLKAEFPDVFVLAPILNRLASLAILFSSDTQIPYLLRSVLPNGLPNLRSLLIDPRHETSYPPNPLTEGTDWYETEDGQFGQNNENKAGEGIFHNYMHSIVRGAPNIEEIGMRGPGNQFLNLSHFVSLVRDTDIDRPSTDGLSRRRWGYYWHP
ncbi:hypothetical protein GALMADRAFT_231127 [Galerina marginata CBS 339.88]|uniref:F-box domain-containing protein n=1 Tax=Galerina marginata (strain CBS 339.88) TaxID=685588 RepID=A0A067SPT7_GALM3|nr:hypothetical protein GALMADRAFT_231127 [Galerina marginata CBS 339.88]